MKHLEKEARKKWCPFVRVILGHKEVVYPHGAYTNRGQQSGFAECRCIASDCMAWICGRSINGAIKPDDYDGYCGLIFKG